MSRDKLDSRKSLASGDTTKRSSIHLIINHNTLPLPGLPYHLLSNFFKNLPTPFSTLSTLSLTLYLPLKLSLRSCPGCGGT